MSETLNIEYRGSTIHVGITLSIDDSENIEKEFASVEAAIAHAKALIDLNLE